MFRDKRRYGQDPRRIHRSSDAVFYAPRKWKEPSRIMVCSWSDFWTAPEDMGNFDMVDWRWDYIESVIRKCPQHTFMITTKRPGQMIQEIGALSGGFTATLGDNVWLGVSVENQAAADERIPILLDTPAAKRWLSVEPMLAPVDISEWLHGCPQKDYEDSDLYQTCCPPDWVVLGCESGPNHRPCNPEWMRDVIRQCDAAGTKVWVKQMDIGGKVEHDISRFPDWARRRELPV